MGTRRFRSAIVAGALLSVVAGGCSGDGSASKDADATAPGDEGAAPEPEDPSTPADDRCCPAGVCPFGESCIDGACHPAPGSNGCYVPGECKAGQDCVGGVLCGCGVEGCAPAVGVCRWPEGCCNGAGDCGEGETCHEGVCRPVPDEGCWTDAQCKPGQVCEAVQGCPCGAEGCEAAPGFCSLPGLCCLTDAECGPGGRCVGDRCVPVPDAGRCYEDGDCKGEAKCAGAYVCPCGDGGCLVPTTPGVCTAGETCCKSAGDCSSTAVCVDGESCEEVPGGDLCFVDGHCGPGRVCEGATLCGCDELCPTGKSKPGQCRTLVLPCAPGQAGCPSGMRCVVPDVASCPGAPPPQSGVCVPEVESGCWYENDCGPFERCSAEVVCTNPAGCDAPNKPGSCADRVLAYNCCDSHRECAAGLQCRNANTLLTCPPSPTATCVPAPAFGETCWNYLDCQPGDVCTGTYMCTCNARCLKSANGWCTSPSGQNCKSKIDCGAGYVCAKDEDCAANPCFSPLDCTSTGKCYPEKPGKCWSHKECGDGYCKGLRVCAPDKVCPEPDAPGVCSPREGAGSCCDTFEACQSGQRCTSVVAETECVLDVSAVCLPAQDDEVSCFFDEDCSPTRHCAGAKVCICGLEGCDDPPTPGTCVLDAP